MEKARLPSSAEHPSYQLHRRQLWTQILIPILAVILVVAAVIVVVSVVTFRGNGDVERWAAVSTIWLVIPILGAGLLALAAFAALVYGMARLLAVIPPYSGYAQRIVWRVGGYVKRGAELAVKPALVAGSVSAALKRLTGLK